jgi:hypothetical protein
MPALSFGKASILYAEFSCKKLTGVMLAVVQAMTLLRMTKNSQYPAACDVSTQSMAVGRTFDMESSICRSYAAATNAAGIMMVFLALACNLAPHTVAEAYPPAEGPTSENIIYTTPRYIDLQDGDMQLEIEAAERFTELPLSIFQRVFLSRTNASTSNASCHSFQLFLVIHMTYSTCYLNA